MENIRRLLPHSKKESKMDKKDALFEINEVFFNLTKHVTSFMEWGSIPRVLTDSMDYC